IPLRAPPSRSSSIRVPASDATSQRSSRRLEASKYSQPSPAATLASRGLSRNGARIDLDLPDSRPTARTMAAARREIGEADLIDLAEIELVDQGSDRDHTFDVEFDPAHVRKRDLAQKPVARRAGRTIADPPGAVGELHDRANMMQPRHLAVEADARKAAQVGETSLVSKRDRTRRCAQPRPKMDRHVLVAGGPREQNLPRRDIHLQLEVGIAVRFCGDRMLAASRGLLPLLFEEKPRSRDVRSLIGQRIPRTSSWGSSARRLREG